MYWTFSFVFALSWVVGMATSVTMAGLVHVLLSAAFLLAFIAAAKSRGEEQRRKAEAASQAYEMTGPTT